MARRVETLAVATSAAFACGALLSQTALVPAWRSMEPAVFLSCFHTSGPVAGATLFPFELASLILLAVAARTAVRRRPLWVAATAAMAGSVLLLGYFVPANLALLDPAFPPASVPGALAAWWAWNWVRAGLGILAALLTAAAATPSRSPRAP